MKSRLTLNNLIAGLQTFFICMTLYAGEKGIMGYAGEKLILAIVFSLIGVFLNKKRVEINRRFKALIVMTCLMAVVITYSYFHSYCPEVTFPYWLRFIFVVLFSCICFDVDYVLKLCEYLQKIGVFIAVIYILTWPVMGRDAGIYMDYQYTAQVVSFSTAFTVTKLFSKDCNVFRELVNLMILILTILITGKRMLFVIPLILVIIIAIMSKDNQKYKKFFILLVIAIIGIGTISLIMPSALNAIDRLLDSSGDTSLNSRVYFWEYAMMLWSRNKIFGIGFACFPRHIATAGVDLAKYHYINAWAAHNIYYQMLAEIGIVGTVVFCSVFVLGIVYTIYIYKKIKSFNNTQYSRVVLVSLYCQLWFIIYGFTGNPLYLAGQFFIEIFGLILISSIRNKLVKTNVGYIIRDINKNEN